MLVCHTTVGTALCMDRRLHESLPYYIGPRWYALVIRLARACCCFQLHRCCLEHSCACARWDGLCTRFLLCDQWVWLNLRACACNAVPPMASQKVVAVVWHTWLIDVMCCSHGLSLCCFCLNRMPVDGTHNLVALSARVPGRPVGLPHRHRLPQPCFEGSHTDPKPFWLATRQPPFIPTTTETAGLPNCTHTLESVLCPHFLWVLAMLSC